jgi:hypothetical protein
MRSLTIKFKKTSHLAVSLSQSAPGEASPSSPKPKGGSGDFSQLPPYFQDSKFRGANRSQNPNLYLPWFEAVSAEKAIDGP